MMDENLNAVGHKAYLQDLAVEEKTMAIREGIKSMLDPDLQEVVDVVSGITHTSAMMIQILRNSKDA